MGEAAAKGGAEGGAGDVAKAGQSSGQSAAGEAQQGVDLISSVTKFIQDQEAIAAKAALDKSNDYDIKCAFIQNSLAGLDQHTGGKFNALIVANTQSGRYTPTSDVDFYAHVCYRQH